MNGKERREQLIQILETSQSVVSGEKLSQQLKVSRQVIVQDITLLREKNYEIFSTTRGYYLNQPTGFHRILKVKHTDEQIEEEMNLVVDFGGRIKDVFIYHKMYGVVRADMDIKSRRDVNDYLESINKGNSKPLLNLTEGFHYHTISADSEDVLALIKEELKNRGFLAELKSYEPVDFDEFEK